MAFTGQVLEWADGDQLLDVLQHVDTRLTILVTVSPVGTLAAAEAGIFAYKADTQQLWICRTPGDVANAEWQQVFFSIALATTDTPGILTLATPQDVIEATSDDTAITPFSLGNTYAPATDLVDLSNSVNVAVAGIQGQIDALDAGLDDATALATPSTLMVRDAAGRVAVVDGAAVADVATKGQMDTADAALQSQVTTAANTLAAAVSTATASVIVKRDGAARFQAAAASAAADVVIKSQLDTVSTAANTAQTEVNALEVIVGMPTDAATASAIIQRDAASRAKVANPSAATDIANKQYADALGTDVATASTIMRRDASSRAKVADPLAATDIANKQYADALGTDAATASTIMRRDASSRAKVADPSAATDIANKQYADALGTDAATVSTIMRRDVSGRAKVVTPAVASDIATKGYVDGLAGGFAFVSITSANSPYTASWNTIIEVSTAGGSVTINIPTITGNSGQRMIVKHLVAGNSLILDPAGAETIEGQATETSTDVGDSFSLVAGTTMIWY